MAKKSAKPTSNRKLAIEPNKTTDTIVIQELTVAQLNRGNQDVQTWINAVKSAESERNPNRRPLYNTYRDVSIDLHYRSQRDKRIRAVKTTPFEWQGLENDNLKEHFGDMWFMDLRENIMSHIFEGPTLIEFTIGKDGIEGHQIVPRQNVKPEKGIISKDGYSDFGFNYREGIYPNYILEVGKKDQLGLLANIAPYILMKRQNLSDLSRYNEMFGMPLRVYYYDPIKPGARDTVTKQAKEYGSAAYIVLPKGFGDVEFKDSVKQSTAYAYDKLHQILNDEITIGVLGQLLTTGGKDGGSYELGKVHKSVEEGINLEDRLYTEIVLNYQFRKNILIPHGYPMQNIKGAFNLPEALSIEKKAAMWVQLSGSGLPIAEEDFYNEFGIPFPDGRPVVVSAKPAPEPPPDDTGAVDDKTGDDKPAGGGGKKKLSSPAVTELRAHYSTKHTIKAKKNISLSYKGDLDVIIERIIEQIRNGALKPGDVDPALWELVSKVLFGAVETGYGVTLLEAKGADEVMLRTLRQNVYRFSAFKNYDFVIKANELLMDEAGNTKPFEAFKKDILALNKEYNINFLRTEYNHAVATSQMASKWQQFKEEKATLPLLQVDVVMDDRTRHAKYNKITRPVDDELWKRLGLPPWDYNCRCSIRQLADGEETDLTDFEYPEPKPGFGVNWGEEKVIFPPSHPQFTVAPEGQKKADNNFGLTLPE